MAIQYLNDGRPDGCYVGQDSSDKVGFFGTTPADQPASANEAAVTGTVTTTATTATLAADVTSIITLLNQIRTDLVELGLIKGEA